MNRHDDPADRQDGWKRGPHPRLVPRTLTAEEADAVRLVEALGADGAGALVAWLDEEAARVEMRARSAAPSIAATWEWRVISELRHRVRHAMQDAIERAPGDGEE